MTPEQWQQVKAAFQTVLDLPPQDRASYLDAQDPAVRAEVESLIRAHERDSSIPDAAPLVETISPLAGAEPSLIGKQFGPYRVVSLIGEGGMGSVWLAERADGLFTRRVALKLVHPALMGRVMTERVAREREILAGLNHPNIARLFDAGFADDGQPYLALEYVEGQPLTAYCDDRRLSIRGRLELFQQVLATVQYAHAHLVIHRDLKPSNILVTDGGEVRLLDFGIAKLLTEGEARETDLTRLGGRALTPDFAAPEQISGAPITTAADVYALGVMLYELLTGRLPYRLKRDSRGALEEAILKVDPLAPSRSTLTDVVAHARASTPKRLASSLRGDLDTIVAKALKKAPTERYATADAFGDDIARYLRGDVVLARPDSVAYRTVKFARRHWVALAVASALVLTLAGGLAATSYEAKLAAAERDAAVRAQSRSLTQNAVARLKDQDPAGAMSIILEVLRGRGAMRAYTTEALDVFQEARATDAQVLAMTGHTDRVRDAAISPDGRRVVTASHDGTARVWDAATGLELLELRGHTQPVIAATFSPDGRRIVTASFDRTARVWNAGSGQEILRLAGHSDHIRDAEFSPDGLRVVTASTDRSIRIWDSATGQQILNLQGHTAQVNSASFSPDGRRIVSGSFDHTARIWDAQSGRQLMLLEHPAEVTSSAFSPDGARIITGCFDKNARIWDATSARELVVLNGAGDIVTSASFSPDGRIALSASDDGTARIWNVETGRETRRLNAQVPLVEAASFAPSGRRVITALGDGTARLWDTVPGGLIGALSGHAERVVFASFSPDGRRIVTASYDKTARIWSAENGAQLLVLNGHRDRVNWAAFSADGRFVVTASTDRTARIWDASTGQALLELLGHTDSVMSAEFSADGRRVATASYDKTARLWDAATGRPLAVLDHAGWVTAAAFSVDGRLLVTGSYDKTAHVWDASSGRDLIRLAGHTDRVESASFSPDGRRVVTGAADGTARIWDAATGGSIRVLQADKTLVGYVAYSPDGGRIVTAGSRDGSARVWDASTGEQLLALPLGAGSLGAARFSPDGRRIVTGSDSRIARIWDARTEPLEIQISWAEAAQFDPLPGLERERFGLPAPREIRQWPTDASACDRAASAPYDPRRRAQGVMQDHLDADTALSACTVQRAVSRDEARVTYQRARALAAKKKFPEAKRGFEQAIGGGYDIAQIDLARLIAEPSAGLLDVTRSIALLEKSWREGSALAAYELGSLYERGVSVAPVTRGEAADAATAGSGAVVALAADEARASSWYRKAADAGEPNALGRLGEKAVVSAEAENDPRKRRQLLLAAFEYYAAASEFARREDWSDDAWRHWRYRRASLARLLAREGLMSEVAHAYDRVQAEFDRLTSMPWRRLLSYAMTP